jgi:hypothetical protein
LRTAAVLALGAVSALAQLSDTAGPALDHPAINYNFTPVQDPVAVLNRKLDQGQAQLKFDGPSGYLRSVLAALNVPIESQIAVFSKTSLQAPLIDPGNPRTIFFNDSVAVGWMKGGFIELAAQDPRQGVQFYTLDQHSSYRPRFQKGNQCLRCHVGDATLGVAGMVDRSTFTAADGSPMLIYGGSMVDHRTPIEDRWGGWYVTGSSEGVHNMGNAVIGPEGDPKALESLHGKIDTSVYLSPNSDIGALLAFDHQMHMANLITRIGWDARAGMGRLEDEAREFVDYLLFIEEAPLPGKLRSTSALMNRFGAGFSKNAPRDSQGRSLRDLDLQRRLLRYPCSYMIYSDAFDALPAEAKDAIYKRLWQVLSGAEKDKKYARLSAADRRAIVEILRETKPDFARVVN